jgi:hypothetical protein
MSVCCRRPCAYSATAVDFLPEVTQDNKDEQCLIFTGTGTEQLWGNPFAVMLEPLTKMLGGD